VGSRITDGARRLRSSLPAGASLDRLGAWAGLVAAAGLGLLLVARAGSAAPDNSGPGRVLLVEAAAFAVALGLTKAAA
jgi:hypothetical protein